jgi:DNA topoisomerase-1
MQRPAEPREFIDAEAAAARAGLRYLSDDEPGITRRKTARNGFAYFTPAGTKLTARAELDRIARLAIPPAWTEVWISPDRAGHLAATGRDAKGRKQYRYNPEFAEIRNAAKFEHILGFARALPAIRKTVARDMARRGLPREKVLATIVHLLETTLIRVGNEAYAKENRSYGLTTLRNGHVAVRGAAMRFLFRGKSGKVWHCRVESRRVAKVVRACQELRGQRLFEYRDDGGAVQTVESADVNDYLRAITGREITAKDFRTWRGTVAAAMALHSFAAAEKKPAKAHIRAALEHTAGQLRNTVAVCRKCYVHSEILNAYEEGAFALDVAKNGSHPAYGLNAEEKAVLHFLKRRLRRRSARKPPLKTLLKRSIKSGKQAT